MSNNRYVYQQVTNVSINKDKLVEIATNYGLDETDLRVLLCLFTELNGWVEPMRPAREVKDPKNFKLVDKEKIADLLAIKKKRVKKALLNLEEAGLIEPGDSDTVQNGYRFTF